MFSLALGHGALSLFQFHALGDVNPLVSLFTANTSYASLAWFPFQTLGFAALAILFLMAATSHDFWLHVLSPPVWKRLHMLVYAVYGLLVGHVALGALQSEKSPLLAGTLAAGMTLVLSLHLAAGARERRGDREAAVSREAAAAGWIDAGEVESMFHYGGKVSAVSNVCRHQNGPLGEGRILGGCITCPWHGYQYRPEDGCSPPPFHDKVATYRTRVAAGRVYLWPVPNPPGTYEEPSQC
jgi:nitrite reductase/ring-hydroxylating ferredoxin subunit